MAEAPVDDVYIGVPVRLGKGGVEEIVELELAEAERAALHRSAEEVRAGIRALQELGVL